MDSLYALSFTFIPSNRQFLIQNLGGLFRQLVLGLIAGLAAIASGLFAFGTANSVTGIASAFRYQCPDYFGIELGCFL